MQRSCKKRAKKSRQSRVIETKIMNEFIKYLENKNLSESTQELYLSYTNLFLQWYESEPINCTKKDVLKYLEYLKNKKGQTNKSRYMVLISLNHYFSFLVQDEQIASNPTALLKIRGTKRKILYNIYTIKELEQLHDDYYHNFIRNFTYDGTRIPLHMHKSVSLHRERNYIMLGLLFYQGLSTSELQKLTLEDINLNKATINIQGSRRSNERKIFLQASQIGSLINYINNIHPQFLEYNQTSENVLFMSVHKHNPKTKPNKILTNSFSRLALQLKMLDKNFQNFKQIRTSVITHWIKTYGLRKAQYLAGHRYISSTENYLPNDLESLTDDIAKYNPF